MSIATIQVIMGRINAATEDSPIAVFTCEEKGKLNAVFAGTHITQKRIQQGDLTYVGSFYKGMKQEGIRAQLRHAMTPEFIEAKLSAQRTLQAQENHRELEAKVLYGDLAA